MTELKPMTPEQRSAVLTTAKEWTATAFRFTAEKAGADAMLLSHALLYEHARAEALAADRDSWHRHYQAYRRDFEALYQLLGVKDTDDSDAASRFQHRIAELLEAEAEHARADAAIAKAESKSGEET